jgi:hypothetical protein
MRFSDLKTGVVYAHQESVAYGLAVQIVVLDTDTMWNCYYGGLSSTRRWSRASTKKASRSYSNATGVLVLEPIRGSKPHDDALLDAAKRVDLADPQAPEGFTLTVVNQTHIRSTYAEYEAEQKVKREQQRAAREHANAVEAERWDLDRRVRKLAAKLSVDLPRYSNSDRASIRKMLDLLIRLAKAEGVES